MLLTPLWCGMASQHIGTYNKIAEELSPLLPLLLPHPPHLCVYSSAGASLEGRQLK